MSQSASLESAPTSALVVEVDTVVVGTKTHSFVRVEYLDAVARPDLVGKKSGWLRLGIAAKDDPRGCPLQQVKCGDVINIGFSPRADRLGGSYWAPYINR